MKIGLIQTRQHIVYDPRKPGDIDLRAIREAQRVGYDRAFNMMEQAADDGADLLVTIEAFNGGLHPDDERYDFAEAGETIDSPLMERFALLAGRRKVHVVAGLYTRRHEHVYNSAVLFGPEGRIIGIFDKVHLPAGEDRTITPGDQFPVFDTDLGRIGMLVCYDLHYPEAARCLAMAGADVICVPTWGWEKKYGPTRAYENHLTVAAAMGVPWSGHIWDICDPSAVVDCMGNVIAEGPRDGEAVVLAEVDIHAEAPPQYGAGGVMGMDSMRQIRAAHRRPDAYGLLTEPHPPLHDRYDTMQPAYRRAASPAGS